MFTKLLLALATHQGGVWVAATVERRRKYGLAQELAGEAGKPLLVVGGPMGSVTSNPLRQVFFPFPNHGCGAVCADIDPEACEGCPFFQQADIRALPFATGEFGAAFNSHILEHMPTIEDLAAAWSELHRVADHVVTCVPSKLAIYHWTHRDHHLWVTELGDGVLRVEERATGRTAIIEA